MKFPIHCLWSWWAMFGGPSSFAGSALAGIDLVPRWRITTAFGPNSCAEAGAVDRGVECACASTSGIAGRSHPGQPTAAALRRRGCFPRNASCEKGPDGREP